MADETLKVGIISCSGEEIPEGTISRLATRRVLELLRAGQTVTLCLPLFLAGGEGERAFAREHPTIAVDGCSKLCAKRGTEMHSGPVSASLVVSEILGGCPSGCGRSTKGSTESDKEAVWIVSERIAAEVDAILSSSTDCCTPGGGDDSASCACSKPLPGLQIQVNGQPVTIAGLGVIFDHLAENGLNPDDTCGDKLLEVVRIYHRIESEDDEAYKIALAFAYRDYRRTR